MLLAYTDQGTLLAKDTSTLVSFFISSTLCHTLNHRFSKFPPPSQHQTFTKKEIWD